MRKIKSVFLILILTFLFTGCSYKKLTCSLKEVGTSTNFSSYEENIQVNFKNNTATKMKKSVEVLFEDSDAYIDMYLLEIQNKFDEYNNVDGINYDITEDYSSINVEMEVVFDELDKDIDSLLVQKDNTLSEMKTIFKANKYSCK